LTEPVKETETGAIELPSVTAATGKLELSAASIALAAAEKLWTPERLIDAEYAYPWKVIAREPFIPRS